MATDNQRLLLTIDANVELLRRNLNTAERDVAGFERKAGQAASNVETSFGKMSAGGVRALGALSGAVAAFGVAGVVSVGRSILQLGDDLEAAADQAGVSVERYQTLRAGLRALEVDADQTDKILKRFANTLGEVQGGTAAAGTIEVLDRLGVTSRILNGEITDSAGLLDAIAKASGSYATEAAFLADIVALLGNKLGPEFAAAVNDNGAALLAGEEAFRNAGNVIDAEYIAKLADANEAIDVFAEGARGKLAIFAAESIRSFQDLGRVISEFRTNGASAAFDLAQNLGRARAREVPLPNLSLPGVKIPGLFVAPVASPARFPSPARASSRAASVAPARAKAASAVTLSPAAQRLAAYDGGEGLLADVGGELGNADRLKQTFLEIKDISAEIANAQIVNSDSVGLSRDIADNLAQGIVYGNKLGPALINSFKAASAEALANGLFELIRGFAGSFGGGLSGLFASVAGAFAGVPARARGGQVSSGQAYKVGERGPELFVPRVSGSIIANNNMGGGAISFDLRGAVMTADLVAQMEQIAVQSGGLAYMASRNYTNGGFEQARRPQLRRGAGA